MNTFVKEPPRGEPLLVLGVSSRQLTVLGYMVAIIVAEMASPWVGAVATVVTHALLLLMVVAHHMLQTDSRHGSLLLVLALLPLLRVLSFAMPIKEVPQLYWYGLVGLPLLLAVLLTLRAVERDEGQQTTVQGDRATQLLIASSGAHLSLIAYWLFWPPTVVSEPTLSNVLVAAILLFLFVALPEELLFRGLLLRQAVSLFGRPGILLSSGLYAVMSAGPSHPGYLLFSLAAGIFWSACVLRSGARWGVIVAHGVFLIGWLLVWPILWVG